MRPRVSGPAGAVDRQFGTESVRQLPSIFLVRITAGYADADTGYSWSELRNTPGSGVAVPTFPLAGDKAFDAGGRTDIPVGSDCFMAIDRNQTSYLLWPTSTDYTPGGGTASGCGWAAGLTASDCLEATLLSASGRCACDAVSASESFLLTSGDGTTWTYPGPADPACADCEDGSPDSWRLVLAGGTTDFAALNGTYTVTRSSGDGCVWEVTSGGVTVTWERSGTGWTVTVTDGSAEVVYTATSAGCCSTLTLSVDSSTGTGTTPTATTVLVVACPGTFLICGTMYTVSFTIGCDGPCLTLTPVGGGSAVTAVREMCQVNSATFAVGNPTVCTGDTDCTGPANNVLRIKISWAICGWDGPGWYCVRDCGTEDDCAAVELLDGDQYDPTIEICSGPYADEESAVCGPPDPVTASCNADSRTFPGTYTVTATGATVACGGSAAASGTADLPYVGLVGGYHTWTGSGAFSVTDPGSCSCSTFSGLTVYWRVRIGCISSSPDYWETHLELSCDGATWAEFDAPGVFNIDSPCNYVIEDPGVSPSSSMTCPSGRCAFTFTMTGT